MKINIKNKLCKYLYINTNYRTENTILLAGTGRSGTTWLSNIINYKNEYRDMFEPFYPQNTKECRYFRYKQYINSDNNSEYFKNAVRKILSGKVRNKWVDQYNSKFFCKFRIIKEIRANFLLKWLKINFPKIQIIFILRHPCAVAYSRMKLGWDTYIEQIIDQKDLVEDFLEDKIEDIKKCGSNFEKQIYLWSIENYIPLKQFEKRQIYGVFYESLCINPVQEIEKMFKWIGKPYDEKVKVMIRRPSAVSEKHSAIITGEDLISNWKKKVDQKQIKKALNIIAKFGLDKLYDENPDPKVKDPWIQ